MPNINAALLLGQFQNIDKYLLSKKILFEKYSRLISQVDGLHLIDSNFDGRESNNWLISVLCKNEIERNELLDYLNKNHIFARKPWDLLNQLPPYRNCYSSPLPVSEEYLEKLLISRVFPS